jgi:hypothetical protein
VNEDPAPPKQNPWIYAIFPIALLPLHYVTWPIRDIVLVIWVRGSSAYHEGVRVPHGRALRFTDGQIIPDFPDLVTGFAAFAIAVVTTAAVTFFIIHLFEQRRLSSSKSLNP